MRIPHRVAGAWLLACALSACGAAHLRTAPRRPPPPGAWTQWLQAHAHALRSSDPRDEDFSDLEFLAAAIADRRLLQLGRAGTGSRSSTASRRGWSGSSTSAWAST